MMDAAAIGRGAAALGIELPEAAAERLLAYARLLLKWNRTYNLTAIRDPGQVLAHHLLDSLAVLPYLDGVERLADLGSGGGLPGIPLAIARPDLHVLSIEAAGKKASFQQQARIELGLANFEPRHARVEDCRFEDGFDAVVSRAFSDLAEFFRLAAPLLRPGGRLLAMKGRLPAAELDSLPADATVENCIELTVPGLDAARHLIILTKDGSA